MKCQIYAIIALLCAGCSANPVKQSISVSQSSRAVESRCAAVLSRFDLRLKSVGQEAVETHRQAALAAVYNTGHFGNVYLKVLPNGSTEVPTYVDLTVQPEEDGGFNWWITWPAIYPLPLYWPIQAKKGDAVVTITAHLHREGAESIESEVISRQPYRIIFYGLFRSGPIETSYRKAFESGYDQLTSKLTKELESSGLTSRCSGPANARF